MKSPWRRFAAYFATDTLAFALNIFIFWVLTAEVGAHYLIATVLGFFLQIVTAFFINRTWTFHSKVSAQRGLSITSAVNLVALGIALLGTAFGVEVLHLGYLAARISAGILAGLIGFLMDSKFTFHKSPFY